MKETQTQIYLHIKSYFSSIKTITPIKIKMKLSMTEKTRHYTEAGLIKQLEEYGIGRPSTYALLVDTIQERGYVKKMDIPGEKVNGTEYEFVKNEFGENQIIPTIVEKTFGQEKNKLVLQELGKQTVEFLIPNYSTLFSYDYTKRLEEQLDDIARETSLTNKKWYDVCKECDDEIQTCTNPIKEEMKETYQIDKSNIFMFGKNGGVIKHTKEDGTTEYKSVKKETLDIQKLKENKYTLEDLLEIPHSQLGDYEGRTMYLKTGPYGAYVEWGDKKESIQRLIGKTVSISDITLEIIIAHLEKKTSLQESDKSKNVIRVLRPDLSIRTGKYGPYLYYVSENGKSSCYSLKKFRGGYKICDPELIIQWMTETYGII
jgi:DNA topoisomerase-1